jgi:hypothetical protein
VESKLKLSLESLTRQLEDGFTILSVPTPLNLLSSLIVGLEDGFDVTELNSVRENTLSKLSLKG